MRNTFISELVEQARKKDNIALIVGDLGFSVIEPFATEFPDRFINAGVAEQNMTGIAAGMASEGYHVFTYSIANFPTFRCAEQIRNDVDYHNLPVTIVGVGGGLFYGNLGYSHHAVQDYALMRTMPNMLIAAPGDNMETIACLRYLINNPQPSYLRLGKCGQGIINPEIPNVERGIWNKIIKGVTKQKTILTTGATLELGYQLVKQNKLMNEYMLCSMPMWSMADKIKQSELVANYSQVITLEDHLVDGGFGSWFMEALCTNPELVNRIRVKGLNSKICGMVGTQQLLNCEGGLNINILESLL